MHGRAIASKFLRSITDAMRVATAVMSRWCTVLFRPCRVALPGQFVLPQVLAACGDLMDIEGRDPSGTSIFQWILDLTIKRLDGT